MQRKGPCPANSWGSVSYPRPKFREQSPAPLPACRNGAPRPRAAATAASTQNACDDRPKIGALVGNVCRRGGVLHGSFNPCRSWRITSLLGNCAKPYPSALTLSQAQAAPRCDALRSIYRRAYSSIPIREGQRSRKPCRSHSHMRAANSDARRTPNLLTLTVTPGINLNRR